MNSSKIPASEPEIDLSQVGKKLTNAVNRTMFSMYQFSRFLFRNLPILVILLICGAVAGYFLDRSTKVYKHELLVSPNFASIDYLYAKVDLLKSKIAIGDTMFLKSIGIKRPQYVTDIEIEAKTDIYTLVNSNMAASDNGVSPNFELLKLLSDDNDINEVILDDVTSRNYARHSIVITTDGTVTPQALSEPLMAYLNESEFYNELKASNEINMKRKLEENQRAIDQIDSLLAQFNSTSSGRAKSDKLVYYNDNTQLNDILETKTQLVDQIGGIRNDLITTDKVIKDVSIIINQRDRKGLNNKMKLVLPLLFVFLFLVVTSIRRIYVRLSKMESTANVSAK